MTTKCGGQQSLSGTTSRHFHFQFLMTAQTFIVIHTIFPSSSSHFPLPRTLISTLTNSRYWKVELWEKLFLDLLNAPAGQKVDLAAQRQMFETYLLKNVFKAKSLKPSIKKQHNKIVSEDA